MRDYELVVVVSSKIGEDEQKKLLVKIGDWVEKAKGKIKETVNWGKKPLAFPIKRENEGVYTLFNLTLPTGEVASLEKRVKMEENILRHLIIVK